MLRTFYFQALSLLFTAPDDALPPAGGVIVPVPEARERYHDCDFCGCKLTARGEVMSMSDKARAMRDYDETIADLRRQITKHEQELARLRAELTPPTTRARGAVATVG